MAGSLASAQGVLAAKISSAEQARQKALQKVPNAVVTDVDLDRENGQQVYDIELVKGSKKYDLTYRVSDGKMMEYGWEKTAVSPSSGSSVISTQTCRQLALNKVKNGTITAISQKVEIYTTEYEKSAETAHTGAEPGITTAGNSKVIDAGAGATATECSVDYTPCGTTFTQS